MGSANMDLRSLFVNFEVGMVTYSPTEAAELSRCAKEIFALAKPMRTPAPHRRFFPAVAEEISRLLAPLL